MGFAKSFFDQFFSSLGQLPHSNPALYVDSGAERIFRIFKQSCGLEQPATVRLSDPAGRMEEPLAAIFDRITRDELYLRLACDYRERLYRASQQCMVTFGYKRRVRAFFSRLHRIDEKQSILVLEPPVIVQTLETPRW